MEINCCFLLCKFFLKMFCNYLSLLNKINDRHMMQVAFVGFITCTVFLRTRLHPIDEMNGRLYLSCLFFGLVHMMFNGFSELPITITRLPVFYKQRDSLFYPAWAFSLPSWLLRIPYSIIEAVVWSCVVYYSVGFAPSADRSDSYFVIHYLQTSYMLSFSTELVL